MSQPDDLIPLNATPNNPLPMKRRGTLRTRIGGRVADVEVDATASLPYMLAVHLVDPEGWYAVRGDD